MSEKSLEQINEMIAENAEASLIIFLQAELSKARSIIAAMHNCCCGSNEALKQSKEIK